MNGTKPHEDALRLVQAHLASLRTGTPSPIPDLKARIREVLGLLPLFPNQFLYIVNYTSGEVVHAEGFERVLGYADAEVDLPLIYRTWHPDDAPLLARITERTAKGLTSMKPSLQPFESMLTVDYRVRKANGDYIKVQRQTTVFSVDERTDRTVSTFSLCRDISNLKVGVRVGWQWEGPAAGTISFPDLKGQMDYRPTAREMEVLRKMAAGLSSKAAADSLNISLHTVNTHRRNLLQRCGAANSSALVALAKEQGWV